MEKFVNNLILEKVDNLISFIKESQEYKDYIYLSEKLSNNKKVQDYIKRIKVLQKEIVKKEVNKEDVTHLEDEVKTLLAELDKIPLYTEFVDKQMELNDVYQMVKTSLDDYFYNILN